MSAYTPGPWKVEPYGYEEREKRFDVVTADNGIRRIASLVRTADSKANARLIAAAPDLLQLARLVVEMHLPPTHADIKDVARAAIAKAEGRDE